MFKTTVSHNTYMRQHVTNVLLTDPNRARDPAMELIHAPLDPCQLALQLQIRARMRIWDSTLWPLNFAMSKSACMQLCK